MIKKIYNILLSNYGPQGWWPVTPLGKLHPEYGASSHNSSQRFEIMIGAVLTQNTAWTNVEKALFSLNKAKVLSVQGLSKISQKKLATLIRSSGYFNQKAERLKILAEYISKNPISALRKKDIRFLRNELLKLKGIGPETADSILLYAIDKPIFVIDAYTKRIFTRIGYDLNSYDEFQNLFMSKLIHDVPLFNEYHALIVAHAKKHCKTKPECADCPLRTLCNYGLKEQ